MGIEGRGRLARRLRATACFTMSAVLVAPHGYAENVTRVVSGREPAPAIVVISSKPEPRTTLLATITTTEPQPVTTTTAVPVPPTTEPKVGAVEINCTTYEGIQRVPLEPKHAGSQLLIRGDENQGAVILVPPNESTPNFAVYSTPGEQRGKTNELNSKKVGTAIVTLAPIADVFVGGDPNIVPEVICAPPPVLMEIASEFVDRMRASEKEVDEITIYDEELAA